MSLYTTKYFNTQRNDLGNILYNKTTSTLIFPSNTTTIAKQAISYPLPTIIKTNDITASIDGYPLNGDQVFSFGPKIQNKIIMNQYVPGVTNTFANSNDGINWYGTGKNVFYNSANGGQISWNGTIWVSTGQDNGTGSPGNSLAYSYDGINWTGLGRTIFNQYASGVLWNGKMWAAIGGGGGTGNTLAYSYDGINWTGLGNIIFLNSTYSGSLAWNGIVWLAGGRPITTGSTFTMAYSFNGITWTGVSGSGALFNGGNGVWGFAWDGIKWIAASNGSNNTLAYTYDKTGATGWVGLGMVMNGNAYGIKWNGYMWIVVGNTTGTAMAYSYNGINWTVNNPITTVSSNAIEWTGLLWVASNGTTNYYSYNGLNWTNTTFTSVGLNQGITQNTLRPHSITFQRNLTVATGTGSTNTLAYSLDGQTWTGLAKTVFSTSGSQVAYNGALWVACGSGINTLAYSYDGTTWTGLGSTIHSTVGFSVAWNGKMWVSGGRGTNTVAYSYDGITWMTSSTSNVIETGGGTCCVW